MFRLLTPPPCEAAALRSETHTMGDFAVSSADAVQARSVAVVSGAAGAIGSAVVGRLVSRGVFVIASDRDPAGLDRLAERHPGWVEAVPGHLPESGALSHVAAAIDAAGSLHHVAAIAGGASAGELGAAAADLDLEAFRGSIEQNLSAVWALIHTCLPHLLSARGDRSITLCSSRNALAGHGIPAYSAAKAGLHGLMHPLAVELGPAGVRVNAVAPGQVATPFALEYHADQPGHFDRIAQASCLGRLATEDDVAAAFAALALDLRAVSGQTILVDAGAHIWRAG